MSSPIKSEDRYTKHDLPRLCQGDLLRDVVLVEWAEIIEEQPRKLDIQKKSWPYAVVVSQECDLHQDVSNRANASKATQDKYLHSVLLCPAFPMQKFREGTHLESLEIRCEPIDKKRWNTIQTNKNDRYHYLPAFEALQVPDIVLDFKHFTTAPRNIISDRLRPASYFASLGQLFREHLSQRFANFLARIALPDLEDEMPVAQNPAANAR